jgi:hypothetical protein
MPALGSAPRDPTPRLGRVRAGCMEFLPKVKASLTKCRKVIHRANNFCALSFFCFQSVAFSASVCKRHWVAYAGRLSQLGLPTPPRGRQRFLGAIAAHRRPGHLDSAILANCSLGDPVLASRAELLQKRYNFYNASVSAPDTHTQVGGSFLAFWSPLFAGGGDRVVGGGGAPK